MSDGNVAVVSEERRDNPDIFQEAESESSEPKNEEPHSSTEDPSPENTLEVSSPITLINDSDNSVGYTLPFRHNRGKQPHRYFPDYEERRSRYPIARTAQEVCA